MCWDYDVLSAERLTEHIAGGVVRPKPHRHRPLHHRPDALAHQPGSRLLVVPDRCQNRQHVGCRYLADRLIAQLRERVDAQAGDPGLRMLGAAPARPLLFQNTGGRLGERGHVPDLVPLGTRIAARARDLAVHECLLSRLGQRYQPVAPEPERAGSAVYPQTLLPSARAGSVHAQIEAIPVAIVSGLGTAHEGRAECVVRVSPSVFGQIHFPAPV